MTLEPAALCCKIGHALAYLITNFANFLNRAAFWIGQWSVQFLHAWNVRASVAASHGDKERSPPRQFFGQELWLGACQINSFLAHDCNDFRMNALTRLGAGRNRARFRAVGHLVEPGCGHLGAGCVVNAGEDYGIHFKSSRFQNCAEQLPASPGREDWVRASEREVLPQWLQETGRQESRERPRDGFRRTCRSATSRW